MKALFENNLFFLNLLTEQECIVKVCQFVHHRTILTHVESNTMYIEIARAESVKRRLE